MFTALIKIAITVEAFEADCANATARQTWHSRTRSTRMATGSIWLDPAVVDRLGAMPGAGESFSDVDRADRGSEVGRRSMTAYQEIRKVGDVRQE